MKLLQYIFRAFKKVLTADVDGIKLFGISISFSKKTKQTDTSIRLPTPEETLKFGSEKTNNFTSTFSLIGCLFWIITLGLILLMLFSGF
ncbi:MAG: hypothetical protein AAGC72_00455 [Planctomycetota bacterium]